jgi:hypothetical protein
VKYALLCAALADGQAWFVRSVRSRTAVTQELVGRPIRFEELEAARRSFDAPPGGRVSISVTITYLERCDAGEADVVFRSFRFRMPHALRVAPTVELARSWARGGAEWHRDWSGGKISASYSATGTPEGFRHSGSLMIRGDHVESRVAAGNGSVSARVLASGPAIWQRPLLPAALRGNPEFNRQIDAALSSAESIAADRAVRARPGVPADRARS